MGGGGLQARDNNRDPRSEWDGYRLACPPRGGPSACVRSDVPWMTHPVSRLLELGLMFSETDLLSLKDFSRVDRHKGEF